MRNPTVVFTAPRQVTGELEIAPLISHRLACTEAPSIYAELLADRSRAMGVILEWGRTDA